MFAFVIIENTEYHMGLSHLGGLEKYYACTLVGDVDGICQKGSKKIVGGTCTVDEFRQEVMEQINLGGYKGISVSMAELDSWAYAKDNLLWKTISRITEEMQTGGWNKKNQEALIFHVKHYAEAQGFI